jgi:alpha-beta hydrolase superfamily lysophospholipase
MERGFVVHRTMADPRWLDPNLEPNDRRPHWCYLGHPETVNVGPAGLARFSTLRSWLSQWSYDESRADGPANAARISVPFLLIENSADDAVPASHGAANFAAVTSADKDMVTIKGATHYYLNQPEHLAEAVSVTLRWLTQRDLVES